MHYSKPGFPVLHHLTDLAHTHVHQVSDAIQPSHPLSSLLLLPSIFPSIRVFCNESALHIRWPKYWSFSFNISPSNYHSGPISFRMDWLDHLAVQGTLKSSPTPQFKSINVKLGRSSYLLFQWAKREDKGTIEWERKNQHDERHIQPNHRPCFLFFRVLIINTN